MGFLIPIQKKGLHCDPANHTSISILCHLRKIIERGIAVDVKKHFTPDAMQLGFQSNLGPEWK